MRQMISRNISEYLTCVKLSMIIRRIFLIVLNIYIVLNLYKIANPYTVIQFVLLTIPIFKKILNIYNNAYPSSIAKAPSCLNNPSIITSIHYHPMHRPSLRSSSLSFQRLEPRLREISLGTQILPERVSSNLITFYLLVIKLPTQAIMISNNRKNKLDSIVLKFKYLLWSIICGLNVTREYKFKSETRLLFSLNQGRINRLRIIALDNWIQNAMEWTSKMLTRDGDIETNPGPSEVTLVTLNCRGLKKEEKLKQLLHRFMTSHEVHSDIIISLQETHLEYDTFKYRWKGKHIFTQSDGAKGGVVTLLNDRTIVKKEIHIGHEAHVALLTIMDGNATRNIIIANLHSPCSHNQQKVEFFKQIRDEIDKLLVIENEAQIILMGDFNTTFKEGERNNTTWSKLEQNVAKKITDLFEDLYLKDCWETSTPNIMTWRHGDKMSKIDRIMISDNADYSIITTHNDWSYTSSDHGAVVTKLIPTNQNTKPRFDRIVRLDTRFVQSTILKHKFLVENKRHYDQIIEQNMNPHQQLEFLKMAIRSTVIEISSNQRKEREALTKEIRRDINFWQTSYEQSVMPAMKSTAMSNLEIAKTKLDKHLEDTGRYLCGRAKSMWYQEGEKSTKYFLNLEHSKTRAAEMNGLKKQGEIVNDEREIDKMVESFYKSLYEKGNAMIGNKDRVKDFLANIKRIDKRKNDDFNRPITSQDLYKTLQTCKYSAPGPDGIPYSLIRLTWNYFVPLLINDWNYSLETGTLTHSHESSYLDSYQKRAKITQNLKIGDPSRCLTVTSKLLQNILQLK